MENPQVVPQRLLEQLQPLINELQRSQFPQFPELPHSQLSQSESQLSQSEFGPRFIYDPVDGLTEEEFKKVVSSTKLSEPEVVEVDGLSDLGTVNHLCPSPPHKFLLCGYENVGRVDSVQGRLKVDSVQKRGDDCRDGSPRPLQCPRSERPSGCLSRWQQSTRVQR